MNRFTHRHASTPSVNNACAVQSLCEVAFMANGLAKQFSGRDRALAYQIKSAALSALIVADAANPNGVCSEEIVGLDIQTEAYSCRLHVRIPQLHPNAQAIIRRKSRSVPAVASINERLSPDQRQSLINRYEGART